MKTGMMDDFLEFTRFRLCLSAPVLALSGYFMFAGLPGMSRDVLFLILSSFFLCAGAYGYNNMTDKEEDIANRGRISSFVSSRKGYIILSCFMGVGLFFAMFLPFYSMLFSLASACAGLVYSYFKLKRYMLLKNIYTGFGTAPIFLSGAAISSLDIHIFFYYVLLSIFISIGSIISDLRDYKGDKDAAIKTIPVCLGYGKTTSLVMFLLAAYSVLISLFFVKFVVLLPFIFMMFLAIAKDKPGAAHAFSRYSLAFLMLWLVF